MSRALREAQRVLDRKPGPDPGFWWGVFNAAVVMVCLVVFGLACAGALRWW